MADTNYRRATIIVSYNAARDIDRSVRSVLDARGPKDIVVVVDNASTDETREILGRLEQNEPGLKLVLLEQNIGFGPANNVGFDTVCADWYFLLNADAWLLRDSVADVLLIVDEDRSISICGLPLVFPDGRPQTFAYPYTSWRKWLLQILGMRSIARMLGGYRYFRRMLSCLPIGKSFMESLSRQPLVLDNAETVNKSPVTGTLRDVDWVCGAAMLLRGDFVRDVRGFDKNIFLYGEDEDICITAHSRGKRVVWCDVLPVVHVFGWGNNRFNATVARLKYDSLRYFIEKNISSSFDRLMMRVLLPFHVYGIRRFWHVFR